MIRVPVISTFVGLCVAPSLPERSLGRASRFPVSPTSVSFPSANPDTSPVVAARRSS